MLYSTAPGKRVSRRCRLKLGAWLRRPRQARQRHDEQHAGERAAQVRDVPDLRAAHSLHRPASGDGRLRCHLLHGKGVLIKRNQTAKSEFATCMSQLAACVSPKASSSAPGAAEGNSTHRDSTKAHP